MKLNGWQRIGIVASCLWILSAGYDHVQTIIKNQNYLISRIDSSCSKSTQKEKTCLDDEVKEIIETYNGLSLHSIETFLINVVAPIILAWGFVYLMLFVYRWIRRGFQTAK